MGEKKVKQIETQYAIAKSMAINKQRLEKIKARQEVMVKLSTEVAGALEKQLTSQDQYKAFVTKLIVQGLLMLLEDNVVVKCRQADKAVVNKCLADASAEYSKVIKTQTGADKTCKLTVDEKDSINGLGGVILSCQDGKITIDNTIDLRLKLVMEQDKPAIRKSLFPDIKDLQPFWVAVGF